MNTILTDDEIHKWWASENGMEDADMAKLNDFRDVTRKVEAAVLAKLREQEPVAWIYKCEPWFDGNRWREQSGVTLDEQVAKFKGEPKPIYAAPLPAVVQVPQDFESWVKEYSTLPTDKDGDSYADFTVEMLWHAWQAAQKANAPEGALGGKSDANARLGLAGHDFTCRHDFAVQPSSGIKLCKHCGLSEVAAKKAALAATPEAPAQGDVRDAAIKGEAGARYAAMLATAPEAPAQFDWSRFPGHLIDRYEGEVLTEELLQQAAAELAAPEAPATFVVQVPQGIDVEGRRIAAEAENHACSIAVWMTRMDAESPDADALGVSGWLQEAETRIKRRMLAAAPQQPAPQPLTDEQIGECVMEAHRNESEHLGYHPTRWLKNFARAVERAHGIGEQP